ncbi:MAG: SAM-dependent methyltransferase [Chloroflexota bacterium]
MTTTADRVPTQTPTSEQHAEQRDVLAGRLFQSFLGTMDLLAVYLGDRLGLYRALAEGGPATAGELAARTGTHQRYVREWLEQQAVTGILDVDDDAAEAAARRYRLRPGYAEVLLDQDSLSYLAYLGRFAVALGTTAPAVRDAFRNGGGVSWEQFGEDMRAGQGEANRPIFGTLLGTAWLPAIPDIHARLGAETPARVADIACGVGWSSIAIAKAYPNVQVDGFDLDAPAIETARQNAAAAGVADRVRFHGRDAGDPALAGRYDLVIICEALHDLSRPVEALQTMRRLAAAGGAVVVVDERAAEVFAAPGDDTERLLYGYSVLCCLACGLAEQPSAATGTVMRPATLRQYAQEAGFREMEVLPIEHDVFRIYRLII